MTDLNAIRTDVESWLRRHEQKELVRFVTVGSVDDGKSTLIGRLLHDTQGVYEDQLDAVKRATARRKMNAGEAGAAPSEGAAPDPTPDGESEDIDFSLFTDGLRAEREQGITIDVAYRYFSTERRKYILADTPGHVQYTRNMATGASTADVAIILLDARLGVLPQSRRHAYIASLLGIPHLVVAVNKMDIVSYERGVFERLRDEFGAFVAKLGFRDVVFLPISARKGDNVVRRSPRTPWYEGATLLEHLETVPVARDREGREFRFPVQYVLRPHLDYRGFAGQVASGEVRAGDAVRVLPSRRRTHVKAIDVWEGEEARAFAPMSVTLRLADEVDISRGDMIVHEDATVRVVERFAAMLVWMSERPIDPHRSYLVKHTARVVPARVEKVAWKLDLDTLAEHPAEGLALNDIGRVVVRANRPLFVDAYAKNRVTGAFIVIDALTNDTVAAGMILDEGALGADGMGDSARPRSRVSTTERRQRLGQSGAVVWVETMGVPGDGVLERAGALASALERALFDRGRVATVIDGAASFVGEAALRCADAGVVCVCVVEGTAPEAREAARLGVGADGFVLVRGAATALDEGATVVSFDPEHVESEAARLAELLESRGIFDAR